MTQIPISIFLDRIGPRRLMTGLSLLGIAGALIFSCAHSIGLGLVGRTLLGMGMACNLMGTLKLLTVWFGPATFATLTGVIFSIGTVGNMAAATPLVLLVNAMGWRQAFMVIAGVNLLLVLILYAVVRDTPPDRSSTSPQGPLPVWMFDAGPGNIRHHQTSRSGSRNRTGFARHNLERRAKKRQKYAVVVGLSMGSMSNVYDLTIDHHHCYVANGILVSNSDSFRYLSLVAGEEKTVDRLGYRTETVVLK
jgi:MFS family permease